MRAALNVLADQRGPKPALQLATSYHPHLQPAAVVQPDRCLRLTLQAPDWDETQEIEEVHVLATSNRQETLAYLALAQRTGKPIYFCAENRKGADGWRKKLKPITCISQQHCRFMQLNPALLPQQGDPRELYQPHHQADFISCPGLFSWDRFDPGSRLLLEMLPSQLKGRGADLGCGPGLLARQLLKKGCTHLDLIDVDLRAVQAAWENCNRDQRCQALWLDLVQEAPPNQYDWVTLNPPFHGQGQEQRDLGTALLTRAADSLRRGGYLWMVANEHLPYLGTLNNLPFNILQVQHLRGYKLFQCQKNA